MHLLTRVARAAARQVARPLPALILPALVLTTVTLPALRPVPAQASPASPASRAVPATPASGSCYPVAYTWVCVNSGSNPGSPGKAGSAKYACTFTKAGQGIIQRTGIGPPEPGYQWDIMSCPDSSGVLDGELIQVSIKTGVPAVSPVQLLQIAIGDLSVPALPVATAPPRGKDGLVGLPQWFWVPSSQWRPTAVTVSAGPVWTRAVAIPSRLSYAPGAGLAAVSCPGPGIPFRPGSPADGQHTDCSFTYGQPSAGQPGNAYQATLLVTWTISWTGSGGAGGVITDDYTTATSFSLRVAQAEALVTSP
jgi:hypothetical protein